ncbi:MAG: hypothetical protein OSB41_11655 [Kiritimatiellae bacterium]|nr:hypothetical protein [Kiritimatiellia bacterium]
MTDTEKPLFDVGADSVDVDALVADIRRTVEQKRNDGVYSDPRIAQAERSNLANLKDDDSFLQLYLDSLRDAVYVDINDFNIVERRGGIAGKGLVKLKKTIWSLLKFYTYRMWSQQNQVNGLLLGAIEAADDRHRETVKRLEARIATLEKAQQVDAPRNAS